LDLKFDLVSTMSNQKPVAPKRGRGRPPKVREEIPEQESGELENHIVNPRFAIPVSEQMTEANLNTSANMEVDDLDKIIQQIHDSEIATAMDESFATYVSNTNINMDGANSIIQSDTMDSDMENILQQIREQEESDLAMARQLAEADNPNPPFVPGDASADDIDDVLEQIRQMEANDKLKKTGHAYSKPLAIDRLLAQQDKEDEDIRRNVSKSLKMQAWHNERERQDREYAESLKQDQEKEREKEQIKAEMQMQKQKELDNEEVDNAEMDEEIDVKPIPKTKEEIRMARLAFFCKKSNS
jgi:hypothetical protein